MPEYPKFRPIPRLHRTVTVTEKVDGTNGLVYITTTPLDDVQPVYSVDDHFIYAGSRNRWLTLAKDNFAFAQWVGGNAHTLVSDLGPGHHYGEWFGLGIQRGYGLFERRFALFNVAKHSGKRLTTPGLTVVPILSIITADRLNEAVTTTLSDLVQGGSVIAPGFMNPEGIVVYHSAANSLFKVTTEHDDIPKSLVQSA